MIAAASRANEEVENAIAAFLREQERLQSLEKSARAAERSVELAMRQYEQGLISYMPLLDSERALVQQQDALAESTESRALVSVDLVAVYRALAGGWHARLPSNQPQPARRRRPVVRRWPTSNARAAVSRRIALASTVSAPKTAAATTRRIENLATTVPWPQWQDRKTNGP